MKNIILGSLISFSFGVLALSIIDFFITNKEEVHYKGIENIIFSNNISKTINIKDEIIIKKQTTNTNYLNSWKLNGTIISKISFAMVLKGRENKLLKLDNILEGYKLKKIEKDKVMFSRENDDIWLYIKKRKFITKANIARVLPKAGTIVIRQGQFNRTLARPENLLKTVNIMPEIHNGIFQGFKIKVLLEGSFLYMHGLRKDDIIKKINGKKLVSMADGISAYQNIASNKKFSISVLRNNTIKELKYEVIK